MPEVRSQPLPEDLLERQFQGFRGRRPPGARRASALALVVVLSACWVARSAGQESPATRIQVVLDASADMRVRLGGQERIAVARVFLDTLRAGLHAEDGTTLDLRVYGAAPRGRQDCSDTRLVAGDERATRWEVGLPSVQPGGAAPLGLALERAAADSADVYVLVTDGGDDCRPDPCAVWRELVGQGHNRRSRLHVVALAPAEKELEELRCLSRAGSGSLTLIRQPAEAGPAGRRLALILRNQGLIDVRATLGPGGEPVLLPVRVLRPLSGEAVSAFTARGARSVPAGMYRVVVESAPPITFDRVMILPGETTTLEASELGRLRVELLDDSGNRQRAPVSIRTADGRRELRYLTSGDDAVLRAGTYDVSVDLGDSVAEREDVVVSAGTTTRVTVGGGGTLLVLAPDFDPPPATLVLAYGPTGIDTLSVGAASPLAAGRYRLIVQSLPVYVAEGVEVTAERETVVTLPETGVLRVGLVDASGPVDGVRVDVRETLTGETYGSIVSGERRLAMPGRYELEVRTVPPVTVGAVDVLPGQERLVRREGLSRLLVAAPQGAAGSYRLEVLTPGGDRRLGEAVGTDPELPVWPGSYLARVWRGRELLWEGRVVVASDKTARIDLAGP